MNLTKEELNRMAFLLGKSQHLILDEKEKNELMTLISIEQPCPLSFDNMIKLGMMIVGSNTIIETYDKMTKDYNVITHWTKMYDDSSTQCGIDVDEILKSTIVRKHVTCPDCLKSINDEIKELNKEEPHFEGCEKYSK
jgi:hypothetical protein